MLITSRAQLFQTVALLCLLQNGLISVQNLRINRKDFAMNQAGTLVRTVSFAVMLLSFALTVSAQTPTPTPAPQTPVAIPAANPGDVATMDSIVAAVYDVISGPAGQKRSWDRFRSLFIPGARLIPTGRRQTGEVSSRVLTPDEYVTRSSPLLEQNGFFERDV